MTTTDRLSARAFIQTRCWEAADHHCGRPDHEHIIWLQSALGDIADSYRMGASDLAYELESLIAGALAWREHMAEDARCATKTDTQTREDIAA